MGIAPWYQGDTLPVWTIQLIPDSGAFNVSGLSTSNFSMIFHNTDSGVETTGTGTFSNITAAVITNGIVTTPATVQYTVSAADSANVGNNHAYVKITNSGSPQTFNAGEWSVVARS